ncbi:MAG: AEC family transporter [Gammaproteobacteria bacterium]
MKIESLVLLLGCLALGWIVARLGKAPPDLAPRLNWWVLNIALPALVLDLIPSVKMDTHLWFMPVAMWLVFLGGWAFAALMGRALGWSNARIGAAALAAGLGNTALVGFPLIEMLRHKEALPFAALSDQLGCSIALAVGGITIAAIYGGGKPQPRVIIRRVLLFPPFLALVAGVIIGAFGGWHPGDAGQDAGHTDGWRPIAESFVARIGATLTPVALFSIGLNFKLRMSRDRLGAASLALGWKLAIAPALIFALGMVAGAKGLVLAVAVLQAGMAPMASVPILCQQYNLETEVANAALGAGLVISLLSVPFINTLLPG